MRLCPLDAALDLADVVEVLAQSYPVARAEPALKVGGLFRHQIEDAQVPAHPLSHPAALIAWSPSTTPGWARVRLLTTTSESRNRSSGFRIGVNSKPAPVVDGLHCSTIAPLGTNTAPKRVL